MIDTAATSPPPMTTHTILDRLSERARERLDRLARRVDYEPEALILREGDETPFLCVVERGRVALRLRVPELGSQVTILTIEPGELLGWSAVVAPFRTTVDAVAVTSTRLRAFDAVELRALLASYPMLAVELPSLILEAVSVRLEASWTQLLDLFGTVERNRW